MIRLLSSLLAIGTILTLTALGCSNSANSSSSVMSSGIAGPLIVVANPDTAVFAMGCFWCAETAFEGREGILTVISGFSGGHLENPSYDDVTRGGTGHYEVIQVIYDADVVTYEKILHVFWRNIDPFDGGGQFCDRGDTYRPALFATAAQRSAADTSHAALNERFHTTLAAVVLDAAPFYPAEDYHQDFYMKDPDRYYSYRRGCRRDFRLEEIWGDEKLDDLVHAPGY